MTENKKTAPEAENQAINCSGPMGRVISIQDGTALVQVKRSHACKGCSGCGILGSKEDLTVTCTAIEGLKINDMVEIEPSDINIMGIAAVVYTVPLIAFIIGLAVAKALDYKDIYVLFSGIAGLAAGFVPAGIMNKKLLCKKNAFFNITRILQ